MDRSAAPIGDHTPSENCRFATGSPSTLGFLESRRRRAAEHHTPNTDVRSDADAVVPPRPRRDDAPKGAPSIFCFRRAVEDDRMVGFRRKRGSARFTGSFPSFCCNFRIFPAPSAIKRRRAPPSAAFSAAYAAVRRENIAIRHSGREGSLQTRRIFFYILLMSLLIEPFLGKYPHDPRFFQRKHYIASF